MNLSLRNFFVKLFHWEYWPFGIIHFPLMILWLWYSLRERSLFYFSASNPGILMGGMLGESKDEVQSLLPKNVQAKTILIKFATTHEEILKKMNEASLYFPVIFKPDLGEPVWLVNRVNNESEVA